MQKEIESRITEYSYGTNSRTAATGRGWQEILARHPHMVVMRKKYLAAKLADIAKSRRFRVPKRGIASRSG
jgi:hypothetical protein